MSVRTLHLSSSQAEAIDLGMRYCHTLASVERAHALDDAEAVEAILAGIDPIELRLTANVLQSLWLLWQSLPEQIRGGTIGAEGGPPSTLSPGVSASDGQPSAAIPLHEWSKKVPCA